MNIRRLIEETRELEQIASKIQVDKQVGLTDEEIKNFIDRYQDWYTDCLAILPDDLRTAFRSEHDGTWISAKIKKFLEAPTKVSAVHTSSEQAAKIYPYWQHPYDTAFRSPLLTQRQILLEYHKRLLNSPSIDREEQFKEYEDTIADNRKMIREYEKNLRILESQAVQYGIQVPLPIQRQIDTAKESIEKLEQIEKIMQALKSAYETVDRFKVLVISLDDPDIDSEFSRVLVAGSKDWVQTLEGEIKWLEDQYRKLRLS